MPFKIKKSNSFSLNPGSLRLRGSGGGLLLREKFLHEDEYPPYVPALISSGLLYHVKFDNDPTYYQNGGTSSRFKNRVNTSEYLQLSSTGDDLPATFSNELFYQNFGLSGREQYLSSPTLPSGFPLGNSSITIMLWYWRPDVSSINFLLSAGGVVDLDQSKSVIILDDGLNVRAGSFQPGGTNLNQLLNVQLPSGYTTNTRIRVALTHNSVDSSSVLRVKALSTGQDSYASSVSKTDTWDTTNENSVSPFYVGGTYDLNYSGLSANNFQGVIGAICVYDRVLTLQEIEQNDDYYSNLFFAFP